MQGIRRIQQDRLIAGLFAALISYMLLLQGAVSAYARGTMAAQEAGPTFIICAPSGTDYSHEVQHPLAGFAHDCCSLCLHVCATGPATLPEGSSLPAALDHSVATWPGNVGHPAAPGDLGLAGEARAPPALSA